jgi:hypothetical protein
VAAPEHPKATKLRGPIGRNLNRSDYVQTELKVNMSAITVTLKSLLDLTDEAFYELCRSNPDVKFERTATGELIVMPPTGGETGD